MCIAVPMKITKIIKLGEKAVAELYGNELEVDIRLILPEVGDYVLVHAGCALEIVSADAASEIMGIFGDLKELSDERD